MIDPPRRDRNKKIHCAVHFRAGKKRPGQERSWGLSLCRIPGVSWTIFHSGSIRSNIKVQEALQEQALAAYEKTVLNAVREVRDALVSAVKAARTSEDVAQDLYRNGVSDFNNVLDAQRSLYALQRELAVSEGKISNNAVRLYKALGGGWESLK